MKPPPIYLTALLVIALVAGFTIGLKRGRQLERNAFWDDYPPVMIYSGPPRTNYARFVLQGDSWTIGSSHVVRQEFNKRLRDRVDMWNVYYHVPNQLCYDLGFCVCTDFCFW